MALSLTALPRTLMPRLWSQHHLRRYARQINGAWELSLDARCLPGLATLPLPVRPLGAETSGVTLTQALREVRQLRLVSLAGTGRSLALRQICLQWARKELDLGDQVPLLIVLPTSDPQPDTALAEAVREAGVEQEYADTLGALGAGHWMLLLDGWDELPHDRQLVWKSWIEAQVEHSPRTTVCVVTGRGGKDWRRCPAWELLPPAPALLNAWLQQLLPEIDPELIAGPLTTDERLQPLGRRLLEVALLALNYPRSGFPANRSRLYAAALDQVLRRFTDLEIPKLQRGLAALGYDALCSGATPYAPADLRHLLRRLEPLAEVQPNGYVYFSHRSWTLFLAAMHLANTDLQTPLPGLNADWQEVVALAAGLVEDPRPLYQACRGLGPVRAEAVLALGKALREHRVPLAGWSELIMEGLARLAVSGRVEGPVARALLLDMPELLEATLMRALDGGASARRWALKLLTILPGYLAAPHLAGIIADQRIPSEEREEACQVLLSYSETATLTLLGSSAERELDPLGRLLCTGLLSLGGPAGRQLVAQLCDVGIDVLPSASTPNGHKLTIRAALALLQDETMSAACHRAAQAALARGLNTQTVGTILQACTAEAPGLRQAARRAILDSGDRQLAIGSLARLILSPDMRWEVRYEALRDLASLPDPLTLTIFQRALESASLPMAGRFLAAVRLALHGERGLAFLARHLGTNALPLALRARIALLLGEHQWRPALGALLTLACGATESPLRAAAVTALGHLGGSEVLAVLTGLVEDEEADLETRLAVATALGRLGDEIAVHALSNVLLETLEDRLQAGWRAVLAHEHLGRAPEQWQLAELPSTLQWRLLRALAEGETDADKPSCLQELIAEEARRLRAAAAQALAQIGGSFARQALGAALREVTALGSERPMALGLASLEGAGELSQILEAGSSPLVSCASIQALVGLPEGQELLRQHLGGSQRDPFLCAVIVEVLVASGDSQARPYLEQMTADASLPLYLRAQAIAGLGQLGGENSQRLLLALIGDDAQPDELRAAAIRAAGGRGGSAPELQELLYTLLGQRQLAPSLIAEALRALGHGHNRRAFTTLLRYLQSDQQELRMAAIEGIADLGDPEAIPALVRVSQSPDLDPAVRLLSDTALIRLGGKEHLAILLPLLESGPLPKRLAALDVVLDHTPNPGAVGLGQLVQGGWPLPLRLRVLNALISSSQPEDLAAMLPALANPGEAIQLRCLAAEALARSGYLPALSQLMSLAQTEETPLQLRRRAIEGLASFQQPEALRVLGELALAPAPALRGWANAALAACV